MRLPCNHGGVLVVRDAAREGRTVLHQTPLEPRLTHRARALTRHRHTRDVGRGGVQCGDDGVDALREVVGQHWQ